MMVVVVMGVAGSGKSTIGPQIAAALGGDYAEGDQFHPPANIAKMTSGQPLDDGDRMPWLEAMAEAIVRWRAKDRPTVLACSALRKRYREILARGSDEVKFVYLRATPELVAQRMATRKGHFMPTSLIGSQFATLEEPDDAIVLDGARPPAELVATALERLRGADVRVVPDFDAQAEAIKNELIAGTSEATGALFAASKLPAPSVQWEPPRDAIPIENLRFLHDYWNRLRGARRAPMPREVDPIEMRPILGNVMLVDVEDGGRRFRYTLYGAQLVNATSFDWTGRTTRDMARATRMPGPVFYEGCYRAVLARGVPMLTVSHGAPALAIKTWARLILPLGDPITRFLVGNVPVVRDLQSGAAAYVEEIRRFFDRSDA
ncbi:MAG: PAS domain-containing protein [Alphaproteobacteria bacterium]|nr:PAS domain-containing protein [Alphaproteobacteria bacterium]